MRTVHSLNRTTSLCLAVAASASLAGCASGGGAPSEDAPSFPAVASPATGTHQPGKFVWYDLVTPDADGAREFYGELFGWSFEVGPDSLFSAIMLDGVLIGGMFDLTRTDAEVEPGQWFSSVSVADVDAATRAFEDAGGKILNDARDLPDRGRYAVVSDPQGAEVVLLRSASGDPHDREQVEPGEFLWTELWTRDAAAAAERYGRLLGYEPGPVDGARPYFVMRTGDRPRAGIGQLPADADVEPAWLPYIAVTSAEAVVDRVAGLGGRVVIGPDETRGESAAVLLDPSGAAFAIQEWPAPSDGEGDR